MSVFRGKHGGILLIAEIGGNHEGNFSYAKQLTKLAIESEADVVKFQVYTGDLLVNPVESLVRNQHFKKFELSIQQHCELAEMVIAAGKQYTASIWHQSLVPELDKYIKFYKIGSGDLTAYEQIKYFTGLKKPILLSGGLATEEEIIESIKFIQDQDKIYYNPDYLGVLQCTSMYPIENSDANLNVIPRLKKLTGLTVGYSDHTEGSKVMEYAVAAGAQILEFHFTDTRAGKEFRDHKVSLTAKEVNELATKVDEITCFLGSENKEPIEIELKNNHHISFRKAVYPSRDIEKGTVITEEDLISLRPLCGLDARDFFKIIGKKCKINLKKHQKLNWSDFE